MVCPGNPSTVQKTTGCSAHQTVEVNIPEFRGVEVDKNAPVAIVVYKKDYGTNKKVGEEFRLYDGRLYVAQGSAAEFKNRYQCDGRIEREGDIPKP